MRGPRKFSEAALFIFAKKASPPRVWRTSRFAHAFPRAPSIFISKARKRCSGLSFTKRSPSAFSLLSISLAIIADRWRRCWRKFCVSSVISSPPAISLVLPKMVIAEAGNFPDLARIYREEVAERGLSLFGGLLRIGIESGEFRKVPLQHAIRLCIAPLLLAAIWRTTFAPMDGGTLRLCRPDRNAHRDAIARSSTRGARGMRPILALLLLLLLAACNPPPNTHWLGYVEGETALIAPPQPGWLTSIEVMRGAKVKVGDSLFTLDAIREIAARDNAAAAIAAAKGTSPTGRGADRPKPKRSRPPSKPTSRRPRKNSCASRNWLRIGASPRRDLEVAQAAYESAEARRNQAAAQQSQARQQARRQAESAGPSSPGEPDDGGVQHKRVHTRDSRDRR